MRLNFLSAHRLIRPWFDQNAQMDEARVEQMRRVLHDEPEPPIDENDPMAAFGAGFQLGSRVDPEVYRAMGQVTNVLKEPMELLGDSAVATGVIAAFERRDSITSDPGPTRDELLAAMATAGSPAAAG